MSADTLLSSSASKAVRRPLRMDISTLVAGIGGLLVGSGFVLSGELSSLLLAPVAVGIAVGVITPLAVVGCLLLVAVVEPTSVLSLAFASSGLFVVALAGVEGAENPLPAVAVLAAMTALFVAIAGVAWSTWPPWLAAAAVLVVIATVGYAIHRYERVMLGLVSDSNDTEAER